MGRGDRYLDPPFTSNQLATCSKRKPALLGWFFFRSFVPVTYPPPVCHWSVRDTTGEGEALNFDDIWGQFFF